MQFNRPAWGSVGNSAVVCQQGDALQNVSDDVHNVCGFSSLGWAWPVLLPLPPCRLTAAELDELTHKRLGTLVKKTSDTYASHARKWQVRYCWAGGWGCTLGCTVVCSSTTLTTSSCCAVQWFLLHDEKGNLLEQPRVGDLTSIDGRGNATRFLQWVQDGCKGWTAGRGRKRAADVLTPPHCRGVQLTAQASS